MARAELTLRFDPTELRAAVGELMRGVAAEILAMPVTVAADGTQWADVTELFALADRLETDYPPAPGVFHVSFASMAAATGVSEEQLKADLRRATAEYRAPIVPGGPEIGAVRHAVVVAHGPALDALGTSYDEARNGHPDSEFRERILQRIQRSGNNLAERRRVGHPLYNASDLRFTPEAISEDLITDEEIAAVRQIYIHGGRLTDRQYMILQVGRRHLA